MLCRGLDRIGRCWILTRPSASAFLASCIYVSGILDPWPYQGLLGLLGYVCWAHGKRPRACGWGLVRLRMARPGVVRLWGPLILVIVVGWLGCNAPLVSKTGCTVGCSFACEGAIR